MNLAAMTSTVREVPSTESATEDAPAAQRGDAVLTVTDVAAGCTAGWR